MFSGHLAAQPDPESPVGYGRPPSPSAVPSWQVSLQPGPGFRPAPYTRPQVCPRDTGKDHSCGPCLWVGQGWQALGGFAAWRMLPS